MASVSVPVPAPHLTPAKMAHLVVAVFLVAVGFALLAPTRLDIAIILREVMHGIGVASLGAAGLISTATVLGTGFTEMFWGHVCDRWSRTGILVLGIAVYSLFSILTAYTTTLGTLYAMRILLGVGQAMFIPAYFSFIGGLYGKRRGLLCGSLAGLFTVGAAINPILTKNMYQATHQWQTPFVYYGVFGLALAACVYLVGRGGAKIYETRLHELPTRPPDTDGSNPRWIFNRSMVLLMITMVFWGLTQYGFLGIFVTYLRTNQHFTLGTAAATASIAGWSSFIFSFVAGYVSDHIGRRWSLLIFGVVGMLLAAPLFVLSHNFVSATIIAAIFQACNGTFYPVGVAYAQDLASAEHLGIHSGAVSGIGHLVAGISGFIVGAFAGSMGYGSVGWLFTAASFVMVVAIAFTRDPRWATRQAVPATT